MSIYDDDDSFDMEREQADYDQAELERLGRMAAALKRQGICVHGWRQGHHPETAPDLKPGEARCLDCGKIATQERLDFERNYAFDTGRAAP